MHVRKTCVIPIAILLSALVFYRCDTVESPYEVPPVLEASSQEITGTVGIPIDTFTVKVKNNVETELFTIFPEPLEGLSFNSANGSISGIPLESIRGTYSIDAKNEHGNSEALRVMIRIAPATPPQPTITKHSTGAAITWRSAAGAEKYRLFRSDSGSDTAALTAETEDTFYVDTPLVSDYTYTYHVQAVGNGGELSETGPALAFSLVGSGVEPTKPVFEPVENMTASEGESITLGISALDGDGDELTLTADQIPDGSEFIDNGDGTGHLTWVPEYGTSGTHPVKISATDGENSVSLEFTITVGAVNRKPRFAELGNQAVDQGSELSFSVGATDPDGDSVVLSVKNETIPEGASFVDNGNGEGVFTWTPSPDLEGGNYQVVFTASDGNLISELSITISVGDVDRPPRIADVKDTVISENEELIISVSASDPDGDAVALSHVNLPTGATFSDNGDGTGVFAWTPTYADSGVYKQIGVIAEDGSASGLSDTAFFIVKVTNKDRPPVLDPLDNIVAAEGEPISFMVSASDPDGDAVVYGVNGLPGGAVFDSAGGAFTWTPSFNQSGLYPITFSASAGGLRAQKTVTITVENAARVPVFDVVGDKTVEENVEVAFTVNASDPDGDEITYTTGDLPDGATFTEATRRFSWTPGYDQAGSHVVSFYAEVVDGADTLTVEVTVLNVNQAPVLSADPPDSVGKGNLYQCEISATDGDGDKATLEFLKRPNGMKLEGTTVVWEVDWLSGYKIGGPEQEVMIVGSDPNGARDTLKWNIRVVKHVWRSKDLQLPEHYVFLGAHNEDTVYAKDGYPDAENWGKLYGKFGDDEWKPLFKFGRYPEGFTDILYLEVAYGRLYVGGEIQFGIAGFETYNLTGLDKQSDFEVESTCSDLCKYSIDVSPTGEVAMLISHLDGNNLDHSWINGSDGDTTIKCGSVLNDCAVLTQMAISGQRIVAVGYGASWFSSNGGRTWYFSSQSGIDVAGDGNDGDTLFIAGKEGTNNLHYVHILGQEMGIWPAYSNIKRVTDIEMLTGSHGWIVLETGELQFTDDAFSSVHTESFPEEFVIEKLIVNRNANRPLVYGEGKLYF